MTYIRKLPITKLYIKVMIRKHKSNSITKRGMKIKRVIEREKKENLKRKHVLNKISQLPNSIFNQSLKAVIIVLRSYL